MQLNKPPVIPSKYVPKGQVGIKRLEKAKSKNRGLVHIHTNRRHH